MTEHIKIGDISPRIRYIGDGFTTQFPFSFPIFTDEDLEVSLDDAKISSGYTVDGAGASDGGSVFFDTPPVSSTIVTLRRRLTIQRLSDFQASGEFRAKVINDELDYQTAALQEVDTEVQRSVRLAPTDEQATLTLPAKADRSNKVLGFDSDGNATALTLADRGDGSASALDDLTDVNISSPNDGQALVWNNGAGEWQAQTVSGAGDLLSSANLSDVTDAATAFANIKQDATTTSTGVVELATDGETASGKAVQADDARLSDARTPVYHTHFSTVISDSTEAGRAILTATDAAAQRTALGVDPAGTDNSTDVMLAGTPDYLTISGQEITRHQIDLANDVTGVLPIVNYATGTPDGTKFVRDDGTLQPIPGGGDLLASNNLSDVVDAVTAFANIKQNATTSATGVVELASDGETTSEKAVQADDARLSDARTPRYHTHFSSVISDSTEAGRAILTAADAAAQRALLNVEDGATADQSGAEIKAAYEAQADTNAFTDAEQGKLAGIETGATADQSDAEIETAYNNRVSIISQADAEAGTSTTPQRWTAQRVAQAIAALETGGGGDLLSSANLSDVSNAATAFTNIKQAATTSATGVVELATDGENAAGKVVQGNDARLSDARTPLAHNQTLSTITDAGALAALDDITVSYLSDASANAKSFLQAADYAAMRTALGVDQAGTDNSTDVTLAGTPDYISISGQQITRHQIDLTSDVTGVLPIANMATGTPDGTKFVRDDGTLQPIPGGGDLLAANNLSDVANAATAFANIKQDATTTATGVVELATDGESASGKAVQGNDGRLSDARTPTAHTHPLSEITDNGALADLDTVDTAQIDDDAVSYAKLQNVSAASRLIGRGSAAGAGDPQEITLGTGLAMSGTVLAAASDVAAAASMSALLSVDTGTYTKAVLQSYHSGEGLGGGTFVWSASTAKSNHDGGTVISNTVPFTTHASFLAGTGETDSGGSGCWLRVTSSDPFEIHDFGAVPSASYDVTTVLDHLFGLGRTKFRFGGGTYVGDSVWTIDSRVQLIGLFGATVYKGGILYDEGDFPAAAGTTSNLTSSANRLDVSGMQFDSDDATWCFDIQSNYSTNFESVFHIKDCTFFGQNGLRAMHALGSTLENCVFSSRDIGTRALGCTNIDYIGCIWRNQRSFGADIGYATDNDGRGGGELHKFTNCRFEVCVTGVRALVSRWLTMDDCLMDFCGLPLHMQGCRDFVLTNTYFGASQTSIGLFSALSGYTAPAKQGCAVYGIAYDDDGTLYALNGNTSNNKYVYYNSDGTNPLFYLEDGPISTYAVPGLRMFGDKFLVSQADDHDMSYFMVVERATQVTCLGLEFEGVTNTSGSLSAVYNFPNGETDRIYVAGTKAKNALSNGSAVALPDNEQYDITENGIPNAKYLKAQKSDGTTVNLLGVNAGGYTVLSGAGNYVRIITQTGTVIAEISTTGLKFYVDGGLETFTLGANDSGGSGYRALVTDNV